MDRKRPRAKIARRALPGREKRVPGGCWKESAGQRRQLEDEEGACAALSVLCVVPAVPKPYHQEVRREGLRRCDRQKGTATFGANPVSVKTCRPCNDWMGAPGAPGPGFPLPSGISGGEINEVHPYLPCVLLPVRKCARGSRSVSVVVRRRSEGSGVRWLRLGSSPSLLLELTGMGGDQENWAVWACHWGTRRGT